MGKSWKKSGRDWDYEDSHNNSLSKKRTDRAEIKRREEEKLRQDRRHDKYDIDDRVVEE